MDKITKYSKATAQVYSQEDLDKAKANWAYAKQRFPAEHAESERLIAAKGLNGHREIHEHYLRYKVPISERELGVIGMYADSSYAAAFGRGVQHEATPTTAGGTKQDELFRPAIKPEGA